MSRPHLSYLVPTCKVLGLAVAALAITAACSDPGGGPDVEPDATGAPDAGVDVEPDAVESVADAAPDGAPDAGPDAGLDAGPDAGTPPGVDELTAVVAL